MELNLTTKGFGLVLLYAGLSYLLILFGANPLSYLLGGIVVIKLMIIASRPQWLQDLVKDVPILCAILCDKEEEDKEEEDKEEEDNETR